MRSSTLCTQLTRNMKSGMIKKTWESFISFLLATSIDAQECWLQNLTEVLNSQRKKETCALVSYISYRVMWVRISSCWMLWRRVIYTQYWLSKLDRGTFTSIVWRNLGKCHGRVLIVQDSDRIWLLPYRCRNCPDVIVVLLFLRYWCFPIDASFVARDMHVIYIMLIGYCEDTISMIGYGCRCRSQTDTLLTRITIKWLRIAVKRSKTSCRTSLTSFCGMIPSSFQHRIQHGRCGDCSFKI